MKLLQIVKENPDQKIDKRDVYSRTRMFVDGSPFC